MIVTVTGTMNQDLDPPLHLAVRSGDVNKVRGVLLNSKISINSIDHYGRTPLELACQLGNLDIIKTLIDHTVQGDKGTIGDKFLKIALNHEKDEVILFIITKLKCDPNIKGGYYHRSPLHVACKKGNLSLVRTLICDYHADLNADLNDKDPFGETPFTLALDNWRDEVMLVLISEFGYDPTNIKGRYGVSPLHVACKKGNLSLVRTLICDYHADLNDKNIFGNTPFTLALENERDEVMLVLISEFGCDPTNIKGGLGVSPLHVACKKGNLSLVRTLIHDYHADINDKNIFGNTPFTLALENERDEVMLVLISEFGYDPTNIKDRYGVSPLHVACERGNLGLVRTLICDYHADLNDKDNFGNTPFIQALKNERDKVLLVLISEFGYDPTNIKDRYGVSPLHVACKKGNLSLIRTLIRDYHADLNDKDSYGETPSTWALNNRRDEVLLVLIGEFGYDPTDIEGRNGVSLLHIAVMKDHIEMLKMLVSKFGMSLLVIDKAGDTPLHVCAKLGHYDCVRFLLEDFQSPIYIRNRAGKTPIDVARSNVKPLFDDYLSHSSQAMQADYQSMQQLAKKKFSGAHHITKLFVVGHPGAGKSSLVEALKREGFLKSFSRVSEKSVPPHTAGIVPSIHTSPSYGRVQFYDFAGDPEYYSSHAAILEKIFQSKVGTTICIIVLDLQENDEEIEKKFLYWSTFISNSCRNPQNPPSLLVIGSHSDLLPNQREKNDSVQSLLSKYNKESVYFSLDCCYPRSDNLYALRKHIKTISEKSKPYSLSQEMSVLLGLLEKDFQSVTACTAHVLVDHINQVGLCLPRSMTHLHPLLLQLQDIGELLIVGGEEDDSYLILSVSQLTNEVHKKLFAVDAFPNKPKKREFNIGLLPESFFQTVLPEYITKKCLIQLQYCQEVSPVEIDPDLSILPNLNASADVATSPDQSLLFFPALCTVDKSAINWHIPPTSYSIGWLARCSRPQDYFPPRFLHVLLLRVALKFTVLAPSPPVHHALDIKPQCKMWKTGVHWLMEEGVECTVELVDVSKSVVVALRGQGQNYEKYGEIMCKIISCVMEAKAEFCPSITPDFFLLDSTDTTECFSDGELFSMYSIEKVLMSPEGKEVCLNVSGDKTMSCKKLTFIRKLIYWYSLFPIEFFPVFQLLDKISAKWHDLGLYLCLPKNTLDVIQEENSNVQKRLKEMVSAWMNSSIDPPCWWHLAKALRDMEIGRLADEIEGNHGQLVQYSLTPLTLYIIPPQVTTLKCRRSSLIQSAMLRSQRKISWSRLLVWWGPSGHPWPPFCL